MTILPSVGNPLMSKWVQGAWSATKHWNDRLVSLEIAAPEVTFVAGQFGRLALPAPPARRRRWSAGPTRS